MPSTAPALAPRNFRNGCLRDLRDEPLGIALRFAYNPYIAGQKLRGGRLAEESTMMCVTGPLTPRQLLDEVPEILQLLQASGIDRLLVEYGSGCKVKPGQLWQDIEIRPPELIAFLRASIEQGIYSPGEADIMLLDRDWTFECLLCHESDIHLVSQDDALITAAARRWINKRYGGFLATANENWEPIC
jgi:hypothetical protein